MRHSRACAPIGHLLNGAGAMAGARRGGAVQAVRGTGGGLLAVPVFP